MKGSAIAYGGILVILIITSFVFIYMTAAGPIERVIVTQEGKMISFVNQAELLIKTFNQSIHFISQRAAYDMGKVGGLEKEVFWYYFYPRIDVLERELGKRIKNNLPSSETIDGRIIEWGEADINVIKYDEVPCGSIENSACFFVNGSKYFSIYDESIESRISLEPLKISSSINSSYFRLLYAGRQILENETFNSTLDDIGNLINLLEADPRFKDLNFEITASDDIVEITIKDDTCVDFYNKYYCLAPLKEGEDGVTIDGKEVPYDYLKLKFKVNTTQTAFTPPIFDFGIEVIPGFRSVKSGQSTKINVIVRSLGGETKPVHLDYIVTADSIGNPETITVEFTKNDEEPNFGSIATIETEDSTIADTYTITITGIGDGVIKTAEFILTVNPSMYFSIEVDPLTDTVTQGESTTATVTINFTSGTPSSVILQSSGLPPVSTLSFSPISCTPNCSSTMTIITDET